SAATASSPVPSAPFDRIAIAVSLLPRVTDSSELGRSAWMARRVPRCAFVTSQGRSDARAHRCEAGALNRDAIRSAQVVEESTTVLVRVRPSGLSDFSDAAATRPWSGARDDARSRTG